MKQIEKITADGDTQYFERLQNRKELAWNLSCNWDNVENGEYIDEDTAVHWYLKDGTYGCLMTDFPVPKKPAVRNIAQYVESNAASRIFYGKRLNIVQNEHYGDWEVVEAT